MPPVPQAGSYRVLDDALGGQDVVVRDEEQVDHQADDLAGREVLAGLLVADLGEPPDQLLEDVAHLDVGHRVGVQVDLAELGDDQVEPVGLVELGDVLLEAEVFDDLAGAAGEALDVVGQVGGDVVRVALELLEGEAAGVVEGTGRRPGEDRLEVLDLAALQALELGQDLVLGRLQHAVQPAQHGQGQHDSLYWFGRYGPRSRSATDQMKLTFSPKLFIMIYPLNTRRGVERHGYRLV